MGEDEEEIKGLGRCFWKNSSRKTTEAHLRNRKQQPTEPDMNFYSIVIDLYLLVDLAMSETRKLDYLCAELLAEINLHATVEKKVNQVEWAVAILGKDRVEKKSKRSELEAEDRSL